MHTIIYVDYKSNENLFEKLIENTTVQIFTRRSKEERFNHPETVLCT